MSRPFRLYHGDCLEVLESLPPESVDLVFADPPYNLSNDGFTCQGGRMVVQHIAKAEFDSWIVGLPKTMQLHLLAAFESYQFKPFLGIQCISELVEALVNSSAKKAVTKTWLTQTESEQLLSPLIDTMYGKLAFSKIKTLLGGLKQYVKEYRNNAHHFPSDKKAAYRKYRKCKNGLHDGVEYFVSLYEKMSELGIRPKLS